MIRAGSWPVAALLWAVEPSHFVLTNSDDSNANEMRRTLGDGAEKLPLVSVIEYFVSFILNKRSIFSSQSSGEGFYLSINALRFRVAPLRTHTVSHIYTWKPPSTNIVRAASLEQMEVKSLPGGHLSGGYKREARGARFLPFQDLICWFRD